MYGLDLTRKEPRLTNVTYPKVFVREDAVLTGVDNEQEPRHALVKLHDFRGKVSQHQTTAKMFDVRRLTDGDYRVKVGNVAWVFNVATGEVQHVKREKG
jgi:hypothetical protein